jgi:hypothetical protein
MQYQRTLKISALALGLLLLSLSLTNISFASNNPKRQFLVGTEPICTMVGAGSCPDIATAANGDKLFLAGSGSFNTNPSGKATGSGSFVHLSGDGKTLRGFGTWTAEEVISWTPGSFNDLGGFLPEGSQGGLAVLKVHISPATGGAGFDGILSIFCALPPSPPSPRVEGINLSIPGVINFGTQAGGVTLFIQP